MESKHDTGVIYKSLIKCSSAEVNCTDAVRHRGETCRATGRVKVDTSILMMEAEKVSEALVSIWTLMQLIATEMT
jgi:hypothetical protein